MKELLMDKGVQSLIVSLVVLIGGGGLLLQRPEMKSEVFAALAFVLGWWFRGQADDVGNRPPPGA